MTWLYVATFIVKIVIEFCKFTRLVCSFPRLEIQDAWPCYFITCFVMNLFFLLWKFILPEASNDCIQRISFYARFLDNTESFWVFIINCRKITLLQLCSSNITDESVPLQVCPGGTAYERSVWGRGWVLVPAMPARGELPQPEARLPVCLWGFAYGGELPVVPPAPSRTSPPHRTSGHRGSYTLHPCNW